jgi:hypothetical protein
VACVLDIFLKNRRARARHSNIIGDDPVLL